MDFGTYLKNQPEAKTAPQKWVIAFKKLRELYADTGVLKGKVQDALVEVAETHRGDPKETEVEMLLIIFKKVTELHALVDNACFFTESREP